ncbi:CPBP family intramembrane metalloprotease [Tenacibaculum finnmarkense genomovar finnmarkense]|uniref:CPBP family intramembrane glutamic endopeptidase n=1 Tax=Tenacibaculum finnmarkense TaxID=2781243 RepID=UPI001E610D2A|nr:CPBP family intramembrane glutamic endopeptidase [Tenacibaculum finnmarkense]MCD8417306.1 CPBP family intramembrane metalloprotease [Tenacibaculum finnmarkense genomovar finnmarkense]MCG8185799.1 CPBP family intramembrane metalloprotease [Tenacibaculum finnmarkense genomovar finnmarkense]MCG8202352.1 CPBP family intramembrane metalloprotease [Tenacibaculum finnmarkense genomovar finnmarkense]MCG8209644.1 CPBP family intramembrane metalloprotease [Tenacibaculum finnmarkense genomovar finnmark
MNFIQQAYKGRNNWLYYFAAITLILFGWQLIGILPLALVAILHSKNLGEFSNAANESFMSLGIDKNLFLFLMILMFAIGLFFLFVAIKFIHKRAFKTVVTSRRNIDWSRFWFGFVTFGIIAVSVTLLGVFLSPENYTWNFKPVPFFTLVAVSFLFLPLQTSFEELLFRGYFMQGLGTWFKNRWMPLIITSVAFGLLHGANPEVEKLGYISMIFYIGTGFFFGITTLMDEGTELVLGVHAINNIVAAFLVTTNWTVFQTDALFVDTSEPSVGIEMFLPVFVLYPLILLLFSKKYGWKNWQEKLTGSIQKPQENLANIE